MLFLSFPSSSEFISLTIASNPQLSLQQDQDILAMSSQSKSFNRFRDGMWTCKLIIIDRQQGQHHPISFPDPGFPPLDEIVQTIKNKYQLDILSSDKRSWSTVVDLPQGGSIVKYFKTFAELVVCLHIILFLPRGSGSSLHDISVYHTRFVIKTTTYSVRFDR